MTVAPTLADQIEAVEWARLLVESMTAAPIELGDEIEVALRGLKAAVETMRTWEFAREVLK